MDVRASDHRHVEFVFDIDLFEGPLDHVIAVLSTVGELIADPAISFSAETTCSGERCIVVTLTGQVDKTDLDRATEQARLEAVGLLEGDAPSGDDGAIVANRDHTEVASRLAGMEGELAAQHDTIYQNLYDLIKQALGEAGTLLPQLD